MIGLDRLEALAAATSSRNEVKIEIMEPLTKDEDYEMLDLDGIGKYINRSLDNEYTKWSRADEKVVTKYITKSLAYKTLYNEAYFRYSFYHKLLTWPLICLSCISIALQMVSATIINTDASCKNDKVLVIITTAISIAVAINTYLHAGTSYDKLAYGCRKGGAAFSEFSDQLRTILTMNKSNRASPLEVMKSVQIDYLKIKKSYAEYEIPSDIYSAFINKHKGNSVLIDISTNNNSEFEMYDGGLEKNIIINKFIDSISAIRRQDKPVTPQSTYDLGVGENGIGIGVGNSGGSPNGNSNGGVIASPIAVSSQPSPRPSPKPSSRMPFTSKKVIEI